MRTKNYLVIQYFINNAIIFLALNILWVSIIFIWIISSVDFVINNWPFIWMTIETRYIANNRHEMTYIQCNLPLREFYLFKWPIYTAFLRKASHSKSPIVGYICDILMWTQSLRRWSPPLFFRFSEKRLRRGSRLELWTSDRCSAASEKGPCPPKWVLIEMWFTEWAR